MTGERRGSKRRLIVSLFSGGGKQGGEKHLCVGIFIRGWKKR